MDAGAADDAVIAIADGALVDDVPLRPCARRGRWDRLWWTVGILIGNAMGYLAGLKGYAFMAPTRRIYALGPQRVSFLILGF